MTIPKFPMHHTHRNKSIRQVGEAFLLSITTGFLYYCFQHLPLKAAYADFYSTYDPIASFNRMRDAGYLDSCPPLSADKDGKGKK